MQASLTDRVRWPWWIALALVTVLAVMWWQSWQHRPADVAAPVPAAVAQRVPAAAPISPAPEPSPAPAPAVARAPALKLIGTAVGGNGSVATVRSSSASQLLLLHVGDHVADLTVTTIEADRIVLLGAAQQRIVLEVERSAAVPVPPVLSRAVNLPASQAAPPSFPEGQAPWDAGPDFRH